MPAAKAGASHAKVNDTAISAMEYWNVQELVCDPPYWEREIAEWSARWPDKVTEFATYSRARRAPATTAFYAAVMDCASPATETSA